MRDIVFRTILSPLDGSPFAEEALPLALQVARRSGGRLELARVLVTPEPSLQKAADLYLTSLRDQLSLGVHDAVGASLLEGDIVPALTARIAEIKADLIVLTTHARGPIGRLCLGSVADRLIHALKTPLLIVPPGAPGGLPFRRVAVPLDRTPRAESIIPLVCGLGQLFHASYLLYHNVPPWSPIVDPTGMAALAPDPAVTAADRVEAAGYLETIAAPLRSDGRTVETLVDAAPLTAVGLLRLTSSRNVGLLALTSRNQGELERLVSGSLLDKVIRGTSVPVLVASPPA